MKKLIKFFIYSVCAIVLVCAIYADKAADNAMKQDILNRSGIPPSVNQASPEFQLRKIGTDDVVSSDEIYAGDNVVVIISSPSCPFTEQLTKTLLKELKTTNKNAENLYLILDEGQTPLKLEEEKYWAENYPDFNVYADYKTTTAWGFKVQAYPTQYVLSADKTILYRQSGYAGEKSIKMLLEKFIA